MCQPIQEGSGETILVFGRISSSIFGPHVLDISRSAVTIRSVSSHCPMSPAGKMNLVGHHCSSNILWESDNNCLTNI